MPPRLPRRFAIDFSTFRLITACASLYYLPDPEIRDLVRYIRTRTDMLVLDADRLMDRGGDEGRFRKASVEFAVEVLEQASSALGQIIAPPGYSRPLVIARV